MVAVSILPTERALTDKDSVCFAERSARDDGKSRADFYSLLSLFVVNR
jgi:hypothetical protein